MPAMSAEERLRRILALVPWVVAREGPSVEEVCARFGMTPDELARDLDLLFVCGVHPYTPDTLIEATIDEGRVWIRYADWFARPLRLTPPEAMALVAAGRTLLAAPGTDPDGPLARGLAKLATALGIEATDAVEVDPGEARTEVLGTLEEAVAAHRVVELEYYTFGRDETTQRAVEPRALYSRAGQWYLAAWCRLAGDERLFRVDRIRTAQALPETFTVLDPPAEPALFSPRPDDPRVTLELSPGARWVVERYPVEEVTELGGGRLRVRLAASGRAWLERLLLRLGPDAAVLEGDPDIARAAATRVLARYRGRPNR